MYIYIYIYIYNLEVCLVAMGTETSRKNLDSTYKL
jgi:hypothetical protein